MSCKSYRWNRERCEALARDIWVHGRDAVCAANKVSRKQIDLAFRHYRLPTPMQFDPSRRQYATPEVLAIIAGGGHAGAPVSGLDYDDESETSQRDTVPGFVAPHLEPAPAPQPAPSRPVVEPVDPVRAYEDKSKASRLEKQLAEMVERVRAAEARQRFLDAAHRAYEPPRILPRERISGVREMTPVVLASDWHCEEPVDPAAVAGRNEYNLEIAEQRIERFFRAIIWNVEHHLASGRIAIRDLVLWLGGDLMSGYIHEELVEGNLLSPTETMHWLMPRLRNGILTVLEHLQLERMIVPCSFGNHGRTTAKPRVSTGFSNSYEWLLYHVLKDGFANEPRVHFEVTPSAHQYVDVFGRILHFTHGDEVRYQGGVGGLGIPLLKAVPMWELVRPADLHCIGHHHTLRDYGRALVNGSLIGYGPYSQYVKAPYEDPQQLMFYVDSRRGKAMPTALWVGEQPEPVAA